MIHPARKRRIENRINLRIRKALNSLRYTEAQVDDIAVLYRELGDMVTKTYYDKLINDISKIADELEMHK